MSNQEQTESKTKADEVYGVVAKKVNQLSGDGPQQRANRAKLRKGIGREPDEVPEIWDITLADIPEDLKSWNGIVTPAEQAIHTTLTLFALHQQGKTEAVNRSHISFGSAARRLVSPDNENEQTIKRRFDAVLTAKDFVELSRHARGLIQLMKAKDVCLDYPWFAKDLYRHQNPETKDRVMYKWGEDFWTPIKNKQDDQNGDQDSNRKNNKHVNPEEGV
ncbi:MAG: type I-E CRISPR-associated protein Cse2/CasB [Coriobacteriales bacterium]|jgi:CRISPR system Cascade subunit CasB|nr:type I-E CRISPR-associated protein Cse2/CasB [Coriobacteriales bacterium]